MVRKRTQGAPAREKGYAPGVAQTSVRMPDELLRRVRETAKREGVTMNLWLVTAIAERVAGSLRSEDVKRLDALEERIAELEKET